MNTFFAYQPEFLYSINSIFNPILFGYSAVTVIGMIGALVGIVGLLFLKYRNKSLSTAIIVFILILWAPLFLRFFYSNALELQQTFFLLGQPLQEKIRWRYCSIDLYQNFHGSFCRIPLFVDLVEKTISKNSKITLASSSLSIFLEYQLVDNYVVTNNVETSDYFILYQPQASFDFTRDGKLYTSILNPQTSAQDKIFLGNFMVVAELNQGAVILKKTVLPYDSK